MMEVKRRIITIDEEKCNGCGLCADACHEGAIGMADGKAKLLREDYCDGLGDCLPACPTGAISFEEREAPAYDHAAVLAAKAEKPLPCGCPGSQVKTIERPRRETPVPEAKTASELRQWPVQLKLVPVNAPCFDGAHLLVAADCTAFAHGDFHRRFLKNRVALVGCPKLDEGDYAGNPPRKRRQKRPCGAYGGALLRRDRKCRPARPAGQREMDPLAGDGHFHLGRGCGRDLIL